MSSSRTRPRALAAVAALALPLLLGGTAAAGPPPAVDGAPGAGDPYFPTYGNGGYDALHYDLAVRYDPDTDRLSGRARLSLRPEQRLRSFHLDLVGLTVRDVRVDGEPARWQRRGAQELVVTPARPLERGRTVTVDVRYDGVPRTVSHPDLGTYGFLTTDDGALAVGAPEVAAHWFPSDDHPSDKATYRIALTAPEGLQAVSNGLPVGRRVDGGWATTIWDVRDPMASYLAFMAVGHFDVHRWRTPSGLPVLDAVDSRLQGPLRARIDASLARQGEIIAAQERWFGPYPFEAAGAVVDRTATGSALENQTRPTYSPGIWDLAPVPTLGDSVVVHELAHQWFGDSVALRRWKDVWLSEGFATYAEWLWAEREFGFTPQETFDFFWAEPADSPAWQLRIGDPGPNRLFDPSVYLRGAMTLQALRATVGEAVFSDLLRTWAREHRDGHGTTQAFVALAERASGRPLQALFDAWLFTPGRPAHPTAPAATDAARAAQLADHLGAWQRGLHARHG